MSDSEGETIVETRYDSLGRVWKTSNPYRSEQDPTYGWTESTFDPLDGTTDVKRQDDNHVLTYYGAAVTTAGGRSRQMCDSGTYGIGYPVLSVDEAGRKGQTWIDGLARIIEVDEPDPATGSLTINANYHNTLCHPEPVLGANGSAVAPRVILSASEGSAVVLVAYSELQIPLPQNELGMTAGGCTRWPSLLPPGT